MKIAIAIFVAYLLGSCPTAYLVARLRKGIDIRQVGSRNLGAMNVIYSVGVVEGVLVLFLDMAKGTAAILVSWWLGVPLAVQLVSGGTAVIGHVFPVFLGFRGGRGGATCLGILGTFMPWGVPVYVALFGATLVVTRFPTFSYSLAFAVAPITAWLVYDSVALIIYSVTLPLIPAMGYIPRILEMRSSAGSWRRVFFRTGLKDRH